MNTLLSLIITLLPLALGLLSWVLGGVYAFSKSRKGWQQLLSWILCACALWCPIQVLARWAANDDIAAILDCSHAYLLCATVLLTGNLLLTVIGIVRPKHPRIPQLYFPKKTKPTASSFSVVATGSNRSQC